MPKRASLDLNQFKVTLPKPVRDPLESIIPTIAIPASTSNPVSTDKNRQRPDTMTPRHRDTTIPSMVSRHHDTSAIIERIRIAVKAFGKEAATHRFTLKEKQAIADLVYTYKTQGTKTSENEIARIGINFIIQDYRENGEDSILQKALKALNG